MRTPTVCEEYVRNVLDFLDKRGISEAKLNNVLGLTLTDHLNEQKRLSLRLFEILLDTGSRLLQDPDFGANAGTHSPRRAWGLVNYLGMSAASTKDAIEVVIEFHKLLIDHGDIEFISTADGKCRLVWDIPERQLPSRHVVEYFFASWYQVNKSALQRWCAARVIHVTYPSPGQHSDFSERMEADVCYSSDVNCVEFDAHFLERPADYPHPSIHEKLLYEARQELVQLQLEDRLIKDVTASIRKHLGNGTPKLESIAEEMGLTARTLQRRLTAISTSFKYLVDQARMEQSKALIADPNKGFLEICSELGFNDQSAFHKAFKRWFGQTPGKFRELQLSMRESALH